MQNILKLVLVLLFFTTSITCGCSKYIKNFPKYYCVKQQPLNSGSNGTAYVVKSEGKEYILKQQSTSSDSESELQILQKMKGIPYVVQLIKYVVNPHDTLFIINYGSKGNMEVFVESLEKISYEYVVNFFIKLFTAVQEIHNRGFIHADLKFEHVVVDDNGDPIIIDFDLSVDINTMSEPKGTLNYMAPEVLRNFILDKPVLYTPEIDSYSLIVMFYEMFNRTKPYILLDINYNSLMNSEIFFSKGQPRDFYAIVSNTLMVASNRLKFDGTFERFQDKRFYDHDNLNHDKAYRLIDYAQEGEGYISEDEKEDVEDKIYTIVQIVLGVFFVIFLIIAYDKCICEGGRKEEDEY